MPIQRSMRPIASARLTALARRLLNSSSLCAISTVSPGGRSHVNTAYFAWSRSLELVWLSEPGAQHSRNLRVNRTVAVAVYDSNQSWGRQDRGIQLFGSAREQAGIAAQDAQRTYEKRFPAYAHASFGAYRFYRFRPSRVKLFDERALGGGVFVTARAAPGGNLSWERSETYVSRAVR